MFVFFFFILLRLNIYCIISWLKGKKKQKFTAKIRILFPTVYNISSYQWLRKTFIVAKFGNSRFLRHLRLTDNAFNYLSFHGFESIFLERKVSVKLARVCLPRNVTDIDKLNYFLVNTLLNNRKSFNNSTNNIVSYRINFCYSINQKK